jgi:hypothetical protein
MADRDIEEAIDEVEHEVGRLVVELVTEIVANLREETPVETGHARANWVPSIARPYEDIVDGNDTTVQENALMAILRYQIDDGTAFISNNVPYINRLNDGHSDQAPVGFIEDCIERGLNTVERRR